MNRQPNPNDLAALEEYYRKKLLEYSRQSAHPQPAVQAPKERQVQADPIKPSAVEEPTPKTSAIQQPGKPLTAAERVAGLHFAQTEDNPKSQPQNPRSEQRQPRILSPTPSVLRAASMVSAQPNSGRGTVKARVTTASGAIPIAGADVIIEQIRQGRRILVDHLRTDASGNTPMSHPLETVPASFSQTPNSTTRPYAVYEVMVRADGFEPYTASEVLVFDGEISLVEAAMIPSEPGRGRSDA